MVPRGSPLKWNPAFEPGREMCEAVAQRGCISKIDQQLFLHAGPEIAPEIAGRRGDVFLDLEVHYIARSVANGRRSPRRSGAMRVRMTRKIRVATVIGVVVSLGLTWTGCGGGGGQTTIARSPTPTEGVPTPVFSPRATRTLPPGSPTATQRRTSTPEPQPTRTCVTTDPSYCSDVCPLPCPTIRPLCLGAPCGQCVQNPRTCPTGEVRHCESSTPGSGACCSCATPTATATIVAPSPTVTATQAPRGTPAVGVFAYITDRRRAVVHVINTATNVEVITLDLPSVAVDVAVSADGTRAYALGLQSAQIFVIDTVFNVRLPTITLDRVGGSIATPPAGHMAYVTFRDTDELVVIDTDAGTVAARISVGDSPVDVVVTHDGAMAYVANAANTVSAVDLATRTVVTTIPVDDRPGAIAIAPDDGSVYVLAI